MRTQNTWFRLTAVLAIGGLLLGPGAAPAAFAQAEAPQAGGDPPARVGRLARIGGTVSFHAAGQTQWEPATLNFPVTSGNSFWTEPRSTAEIEVGPTHIALDQSTEFDIDTLDDHTLTATLPQGAAYLRLRNVPPGDTYQIRTPRGVVTIAEPGQYAVAAGDTDHPTTVSVVDGSAQVFGDNVSLIVRPRQTAQITGADSFQPSVGPLVTDPFLSAHLAQQRPPVTGPYAPPPVVSQMTGGDALAETGSWEPNPEYGQVWYPPVAPGWVPYRSGHWAFVPPWGWTWVDDAPWGFAPFHYGRWVQFGPRWGWVPVVPGLAVAAPIYPVYAPALVSFVGVGVGVGIGFALGSSVGWCPLGPREPYFPPYRVSNTYIRNVNVTHVTNVTNFNNVTVNKFVNRNATTVVPAATMTGSRPVGPAARRVPPQTLASMQAMRAPPVQPTAGTAGVTPAVARQMNLAQPGPGLAAPRRVAPGPVVQPNPAAGMALRSPGGPGAPRGPGAPGAPGAPGVVGAPVAPGTMQPGHPGLGTAAAGAAVG
ncbi:DUF6600 domain-containing protein, partial [Limobrevibacterium gyesilva]